MSATINKEQSSSSPETEWIKIEFQFELSPGEVPIGNLEASSDHSPASFPLTHPIDNVLYDNVETLDISNWNDDVRADQTALLPTEFNHAKVPNWNYNSTGDTATTSLDSFMNFQNFISFEPKATSSDTRYLQGLWDGIDAAINVHGQ
ncbi:uncharacterized protein EAF01_004227 [Botrytis porri]|uniref:Uncharacterized protein n=1 Tax=Botrytis porri TaxID=87229 RepID=A0A4Z1KV91_9HELO|nr:uncharacterized protein EAF01_004227 [Botrytis porri]KAF7908472.1 hypothetical protein EAF01_004227 [Botrytis porri]TGO88462.1 hypothetical protein BPOR_0161g00160 [Botrytis porri]